MCGRFTLAIDSEKVERAFNVQVGFDLKPSYNVAPTHNHPVIVLNEFLQIIVKPMPWGLIPPYDNSPAPRKHYNARCETISLKPTFRHAFNKHRCLVIADGFFEWLTVGKVKQPYYFKLESGEPFALAGIFESKISNNLITEGFSLITTEANEVVAPIHDRMPVIIEKEFYDKWISSTSSDEVISLLKPFAKEKMIAYPVTKQMSKPIFNNVECVKPLTKNQNDLFT